MTVHREELVQREDGIVHVSRRRQRFLALLDVLERVVEVHLDHLVLVRVISDLRQLLADLADELTDQLVGDGLAAVLSEVEILVEDLDEKLQLRGRLHALIGGLDRFLQALSHSFAIPHLLTVALLGATRPEQMSHVGHCPALIRLLEEARCGVGALSAEGSVALFTKASAAFDGADEK